MRAEFQRTLKKEAIIISSLSSLRRCFIRNKITLSRSKRRRRNRSRLKLRTKDSYSKGHSSNFHTSKAAFSINLTPTE